MARRNRRKPPPEASGSAGPWTGAVESDDQGDWIVRQVSGAAATKSYRCPGCDQEIVEGTPHVVTWLDGALVGVDDRRHWHTPCWSRRKTRRRK